jgi:serine/threonine-protein kinase
VIGKTIGNYKITEKLGAGGMGEVYRAHDDKLDRDVAIKVLPDLFTSDPERLVRFDREAKLLASLSHPNVGSVFGFEHVGSGRYIILELIEGEDLSERLTRGPMALEDAIVVGRQVADALAAAHDQGIIHRDLKPGNIKVMPDDSVKVLDFGLAKALDSGGDSDPQLSQSPTMLLSSPTVQGVILGTAAYMSPEQARGKAVDKRTDVWALGCVLFEMLTGRMAFSGETVSDTLAAVLRGEPDWDALPAKTPPAMRRLLNRMLEKDPAKRLRDVSDARLELEDALAEASGSVSAVGNTHTAPTGSSSSNALPWALLVIVGAVAAFFAWKSFTPAAEPFSGKLAVVLPDTEKLPLLTQHVLGISPDGGTLAYVSTDGEERRVFVRKIDDEVGRAIPGTENASAVFFSADGASVGFVSGTVIRRVSIAGGAPQDIVEAPQYRGAHWASDGTIVYSPTYTSCLYRVPDTGGTPVAITVLDTANSERTHRWPQMLPGNNAVLFTANDRQNSEFYDNASIDVVSLETGERKRLIENARQARYVPTGHLVFARGMLLFAVPFSLERLAVEGSPVQVMDDVSGTITSGASQFAYSDNGVLLYQTSENEDREADVVLLDRDAQITNLPLEPKEFRTVALSPDRKRVAFGIGTVQRESDIWIYNLEQETMNRLTFDGESGTPVWSPDGKRIIHTTLGNPRGLMSVASDGSGDARRLTTTELTDFPASVSPDGVIAFTRTGGPSGADIFLLDPETGEEKAFRATESEEVFPDVSPDGKHIAFASDQDGRLHIYVAPRSGEGGQWQISQQASAQPRWSSSGDKLYYYSTRTTVLMEVSVETDPVFSPGTPTEVFEVPFEVHFTHLWSIYDNYADDDQFLFLRQRTGTRERTFMNIVFDAFAPIRAIATGQ